MALPGYSTAVSVATGLSETYAAFDGAMDFTIGDSADVLDKTDFADSRLRRKLMGLRDITMSISGDLEPSDSGYMRVRATYESGETLYVQILGDGTNGYKYAMVVESLERSATVDGKVAMSVSLQHEGSSAPTVVGSGF